MTAIQVPLVYRVLPARLGSLGVTETLGLLVCKDPLVQQDSLDVTETQERLVYKDPQVRQAL